MTNKPNAFKNLPVQTNIQSGSGLINASMSTTESPLKVHDGVVTKIPIVPTMSLTTAEQLIKQTKAAAAGGDLFMTGKNLSNTNINSFVSISIRLGHWTR
jgi:hypothetical protein